MKRSVDGRRILGEYAEIHLGDEVQKPDMDVVVYSPQQETPITLLSCKTSLRERAGQTIKWKLLLDLATSRCTHKTGNNDCPATRYALRIDTTRPIRVVFVTADLYGETAQPQQAGLLSLFDAAYVTKPSADIPQGIVPFSDIVSYIRSQYPDG
jgi:type II restriction enzyme